MDAGTIKLCHGSENIIKRPLYGKGSSRQVLSVTEILCMYPTHHEADVERFTETVNDIYLKRHAKTYLQQMRENAGMSREEVSMQSG